MRHINKIKHIGGYDGATVGTFAMKGMSERQKNAARAGAIMKALKKKS